jgi:hypothetical protein
MVAGQESWSGEVPHDHNARQKTLVHAPSVVSYLNGTHDREVGGKSITMFNSSDGGSFRVMAYNLQKGRAC